MTNRSRRQRLERFFTLMHPAPGDSILDVGVCARVAGDIVYGG
jgi:hypothetical protein